MITALQPPALLSSITPTGASTTAVGGSGTSSSARMWTQMVVGSGFGGADMYSSSSSSVSGSGSSTTTAPAVAATLWPSAGLLLDEAASPGVVSNIVFHGPSKSLFVAGVFHVIGNVYNTASFTSATAAAEDANVANGSNGDMATTIYPTKQQQRTQDCLFVAVWNRYVMNVILLYGEVGGILYDQICLRCVLQFIVQHKCNDFLNFPRICALLLHSVTGEWRCLYSAAYGISTPTAMLLFANKLYIAGRNRTRLSPHLPYTITATTITKITTTNVTLSLARPLALIIIMYRIILFISETCICRLGGIYIRMGNVPPAH
jgi:hypothetical protein